MKTHKLTILVLLMTPAFGACGRKTTYKQSELAKALQLCEQRFPVSTISYTQRFTSCQAIEGSYQLQNSYQQCVADAHQASQETTAGGLSRTAKKSIISDSAGTQKNATASADILTNVRHQGVDEGDFVKISADQIFVSDGGKINVIDRKSKKHIGAIHLDDKSIQQSNENASLLLSGNKLIAVWQKKLSIFDLQNQVLPSLRQQKTMEIQPHELRLLENRIVMVSTRYIPYKQNTSSNDSRSTLDLSQVPCTTIYPAVDGGFSDSYTEVELTSVDDIHKSKTLSFMGYNKLYMTDKNLYLFENSFRGKENSLLRKVSLTQGDELNLTASGEVKGRIKDVWALAELPSGELAAASSSGNLWDGSARNHFSVLSEQQGRLAISGQTPEFAPNEDIRSVRFVGNIAYVVTFKKTDPLFAIDISQPRDPKIIGELKIPGFSTYMHPLNADRLVGLGFDALEQGDFALFQGLQLSLFDTTNPLEMSRKDVQIFGGRGSSSAATADHRAFYLDQSEGVLAFPISLIGDCASASIGCQKTPVSFLPQTGHSEGFSGAVVTRAQDDGFLEPQYLTHSDLLPNGCKMSAPRWNWWEDAASSADVQRFFKIDGETVSVSKSGLKVIRLGSTIETLLSSRWDASCNWRYPSYGL
ncbi:MAG: hypothetical protein RL189_919 [Pseudomonadota bacterium]